MSIGRLSGMSAYEQMQAWSARRSAAYQTFQSQNSVAASAIGGAGTTLTAMLTGGSDTKSTFILNEALSSSLYGNVSNNLSAEETLMTNIIYTRIMKEQAA